MSDAKNCALSPLGSNLIQISSRTSYPGASHRPDAVADVCSWCRSVGWLVGRLLAEWFISYFTVCVRVCVRAWCACVCVCVCDRS